jgi:hypothetical protein
MKDLGMEEELLLAMIYAAWMLDRFMASSRRSPCDILQGHTASQSKIQKVMSKIHRSQIISNFCSSALVRRVKPLSMYFAFVRRVS